MDGILENKHSNMLNLTLTLKQQIWVQIIVPRVAICWLYVVNIMTDISLGIVLILERHVSPGIVTILLVYTPAFLYLTSQIFSHFLTTNYSWRSLIMDCFIYIGNIIIYPFITIKRLVQLMLLVIKNINEEIDCEEPFKGSHSVSPQLLHMYLFLEPFVHYAPQVILQLHLTVLKVSNNISTECLQVFCIFCSLTNIALSFIYYRYNKTENIFSFLPPIVKNEYENTKEENKFISE
uniref:XK-related protein n=1 Tax=Clastoptera arizonana TaxID=38151 RepID=A0A1B6CZR1_9HEMI